MFRSRRILASCALALALGAPLSGCKPKSDAPAFPRRVVTITAEPQDMLLAAESSGQIEARYVSNVGFLVGGRLISRAVDVGALVKPGDLLAQIDPTDFQNRLQAAQAKVVAAQATLDQAAPQEARYRKLLTQGFTPQADYDQALKSLQTAQANLLGAQAELRLAQDQLKYAHLVAPSDGVVTQTAADPGQVVQAGQTVIQIARVNEREAVFAVSPQQIAYAHPGLKVKVWLQGQPATVIAGQVREIAPNADPATGTYLLKVSLPNAPAPMRLGAVVVGRAEVEGGVMTRIPSGALLQTGERPQVWIVSTPGSVVHKRDVVVFRYDTEAVIVSSGLAKGDLVVTRGVNSLAEGQRVALSKGDAR